MAEFGEFKSETTASGARPAIFTMGFDDETVQKALVLAGGNEGFAIDAILNCELHNTATASAAAIAHSFGAVAPSLSSFRFTDNFIGKSVSVGLGADGHPLSPAGQLVQIKRPLELIKTARWFFVRRSPVYKRHREDLPPALGHVLVQVSPWVPVRLMFGCVATTCQRLTAAPRGVHVAYRTTWRWAECVMQRVTRGRARRVQVRPQANWLCFSCQRLSALCC
jgi:hypothetical protein